jgi:hypothetical protein
MYVENIFVYGKPMSLENPPRKEYTALRIMFLQGILFVAKFLCLLNVPHKQG